MFEVVVNLIARTSTGEELEVHAWLDEEQYGKGITVTDKELSECSIKPHEFHGEWNYEIRPRKHKDSGNLF